MKQLRCQPGDLAVIVKGQPKFVGRICEVVRVSNALFADWDINIAGHVTFSSDGYVGARDENLKPIPRGNPDATTETRTESEVPA